MERVMFRTRTSLVSKAAQASRFQRDAPSEIDSGCGSATWALRRSQVVGQVVSHADLSGSERPIVHRGRLEEEQFVAAGRLAGVVVALVNGARAPAKSPKSMASKLRQAKARSSASYRTPSVTAKQPNLLRFSFQSGALVLECRTHKVALPN